MVMRVGPQRDGGSIPTSPLQFSAGRSKAADQLVLDHHYSHRLPQAVRCCVSAVQDGVTIGAVYFSSPPTRWSETVLELIRLVKHPAHPDLQLTKLISVGRKTVKKTLPEEDLIISNADSTFGHHGGVYQASSWNFHEQRKPRLDGFIIDGTFVGRRTCNARWGTSSVSKLKNILGPGIEEHFDAGKYLYWVPLRKTGERKAQRLGLKKMPYPKPAADGLQNLVDLGLW